MNLIGKKNSYGLLVLFCVFLMISTSVYVPSAKELDSFSSSLAHSSTRGITYYVGGSGPGNYSVIQQAIDNASTGDLVYVYAGTYSETIDIEKDISLVGEDMNTTIIDASFTAHGVHIGSVRVSISHFTILNGNDYGLYLDNTQNSIISNLIITNATDAGIFAYSLINCSIFHNQLYDNKYGIYLTHSSRQNLLFSNTVDNQSQRGMYLINSYDNRIEHNYLSQNDEGIVLFSSDTNVISNNTIIDNIDLGIKLKESLDNILRFNTIIDNDIGVDIQDGSSNNILYGNTITTSSLVPPITIDDALVVQMNSMNDLNVLENDYDRDGWINRSTLSILSPPVHGLVSINPSNQDITYTPTTGYNGSDSFQYVVGDNEGLISEAGMVNINVYGDEIEDEIHQEQTISNRSLQIYDNHQMAQSLQMQPGTITRISVYLKKIGNPTTDIQLDMREDNITGNIISSSSVSYMDVNSTSDWIEFDIDDIIIEPIKDYFIILKTASGNRFNSYVWDFGINDYYNRGNMFVSIDDGVTWGEKNNSDVCFKIFRSKGIIPCSANDSYFTTEDAQLDIPVSKGVLSNDYDIDNSPSPLTAILVDDVDHGTLSLQDDGSFTYTPDFDFIGVDSFSYRANDGTNNASDAVVIINVTQQSRYTIYIAPTMTGSEDNILYHNNLITDSFNPLIYDQYDNIWDNTTLTSFGGNYYSCYNEPSEGAVDMDMDQIIDEAYSIYGGSNLDQYPLMGYWKYDIPIADFSWEPFGPITDLIIQFTDESIDDGIGVISSWNWSFGDGNYSLSQNPKNNYANIGIYPVRLTVTDDDGLSDTIIKTITVSANPPTADFEWNPIQPFTFQTINFTDLSFDDGTVMSWMWDFGDGNTSMDQNPSHMYSDNGVYTISLTVGDNDGAIDSIDKNITVLNRPPVLFNDSVLTIEETDVWIAVLTNDYDLDGVINISSLNIVTTAENGTLNVNHSTGEIQYMPDPYFSGNDSFIYGASDDDGNQSVATVFITVLHLNLLPRSHNDSFVLVEDTLLSVDAPGVLENDSDPDAGPNALSAILVSNASHGIVNLDSDGSFAYQPNSDYNGTDMFSYQAFDGLNYSNITSVSLSIQNVNDAPVASDDSVFMDEDTIWTNWSMSVLNNDIDVDNASIDLSAQLVNNVGKGTLFFYENGTFIYHPDENSTGIDSFTYLATDGLNDSDPATVEILVGNINDPPVARNDSYMVTEDEELVVNSPGVLHNDFDIDSSGITAIRLSNTSHGVLTFYTDGSFTYQPNSNFYGFDSFTYQAFDGSLASNTAIVTIQVVNTNEPPIAHPDSYSVLEDNPLMVSSPGILANDSDPDSAPSSMTVNLSVDVAHGLLSLQSDGSFSYVPDQNFSGIDSFVYRAYDGLNYSANATVTITINPENDAPVAVDNLYSIQEDTILSVNAPGVLSNDVDSDNSTADLTAVLDSSVHNGTLVFQTNGSFEYTPDPDFFGMDSFDYMITDGIEYSTSSATVTILVNSVNDVPVSINDSYTIMEDELLLVNESVGVLHNDYDPDDYPDELIVELTHSVNQGNLTLYENGSFMYLPNEEYSGFDYFSYVVFDGLNYSSEAMVEINVTNVDDSPIGEDDAYFTLVNQTLSIPAFGVLENDIDADNLTFELTAQLVSDVTHGALTLHANGSFVYTPFISYTGPDAFTYVAYDGNTYSDPALVNITVIEENIVPIAFDDTNYTLVNTELFVPEPGILANDENSDGGIPLLTAHLISDVSHGTLSLFENGSYVYMPDTDWTGTDLFTYQAYDGLNYSNSATVTIMVVPENIPPIALNDSFETNEHTWLNISGPGVLNNDYDPDDAPASLTFSLIDDVNHGVLNSFTNGSFTYLPDSGFSGVDQFTYQAFDGLNYSNAAVVSIIVGSGNQIPITLDDSYTILEDSIINVNESSGVLHNDYDPDAGPNSLIAVLIDDVNHGSLWFNETGAFDYLPDANYSGIDTFTYQAYDGMSYSNLTMVALAITEVNDAPVAVDDEAVTLKNTSILIDVTSNDYDIDGVLNLSSLLIDGLPIHGSVLIEGNQMNYTPDPAFNGTDMFTYTIDDELGETSNSGMVTVTVVNGYVDSNQTIFDRGYRMMPGWDAAQEFIPTTSIISFMELYLSKFGSPTGDVTIQICQASIDGPVVYNGTIHPGDVSDYPVYEWLIIEFPDIAVTPGETYFVVLKDAIGSDTHNCINWGWCDSYPSGSGGPYDGGWFYFRKEGNPTWAPIRDWDFTFKMYTIE